MRNLRAVFTGPFQIEWICEQIPPDCPKPGELLVRSRYSLISPGTELAVYTGSHVGFGFTGEQKWTYPLSMSYATVGQVDRVGSEISEFEHGDWVFVGAVHPRFVTIDPAKGIVCRVPEETDLRRVPFAALAAVALTALRLSPAQPLQCIAVVGLGLIGNLAAQLYHLAQGKVVGFDPVSTRREVARRCGIDKVLDPKDTDMVEPIRDYGGGDGADIVVEASGSPDAVPLALRLARPRGQVILLGSTRGTVKDLDIYSLVHRPGIVVKGAHSTVFPQFSKEEGVYSRYEGVVQMLELISQSSLRVDPLVTDVVPPKEIGQAYDSLLRQEQDHLGILLDWEQLEY